MALAAGDQVIAAATTAAVAHGSLPKYGFVQSLGPPVLVDWSDGTQSSYAAVGSGGTSVLYTLDFTVPSAALIGQIVQPTVASGIPNPGGRVRGPVVNQFKLVDPVGAVIGEVVVFETPIGVMLMAYASVVAVPGA